MKTHSICRLLMLALLSAPLTGQAHDSLEAMQQGGSLMKLTAALLHPLLETPYWSALLLVGLSFMLLYGAVKLFRKSIGSIAYGRQSQPVRAVNRRNPR